MINTYVIDLFCGAGGTSTAIYKSKTNISVMACINHDKNAIISHAENYPDCLHFIEDIRTIGLEPLLRRIKKLRKKDPTCRFALWASLECTNFSKAKCGPKDPDSRTLAEHLFRYLDYMKDYIDFLWIENVEEFMLWGPLDSAGKPIKALEGSLFSSWCAKLMKDYFKYAIWDTYTSADYAGYTIRKRLFMQFSRIPVLGIPVQTHSAKGGKYKQWLPVKDVLDLNNHGKSIFTRKKPFVPNTHRRILRGIKKFGKTSYGIQYYGQSTTQNLNKPCATLTTKDRISIVKPVFLKHDYGASVGSSLNNSAPTLPGNPAKFAVVSAKFLHNPQYGGHNRSIEDPAYTLIARQDKAPAGITTAIKHSMVKHLINDAGLRNGRDHIVKKGDVITYYVFSDDDQYMQDIKRHMFKYSLEDILVRPLTIEEMLSIQGFPKGYKLYGTQTEKKKYIGNSVEVKVGVALFRAIDHKIQNYALAG